MHSRNLTASLETQRCHWLKKRLVRCDPFYIILRNNTTTCTLSVTKSGNFRKECKWKRMQKNRKPHKNRNSIGMGFSQNSIFQLWQIFKISLHAFVSFMYTVLLFVVICMCQTCMALAVASTKCLILNNERIHTNIRTLR